MVHFKEGPNHRAVIVAVQVQLWLQQSPESSSWSLPAMGRLQLISTELIGSWDKAAHNKVENILMWVPGQGLPPEPGGQCPACPLPPPNPLWVKVNPHTFGLWYSTPQICKLSKLALKHLKDLFPFNYLFDQTAGVSSLPPAHKDIFQREIPIKNKPSKPYLYLKSTFIWQFRNKCL